MEVLIDAVWPAFAIRSWVPNKSGTKKSISGGSEEKVKYRLGCLFEQIFRYEQCFPCHYGFNLFLAKALWVEDLKMSDFDISRWQQKTWWKYE